MRNFLNTFFFRLCPSTTIRQYKLAGTLGTPKDFIRWLAHGDGCPDKYALKLDRKICKGVNFSDKSENFMICQLARKFRNFIYPGLQMGEVSARMEKMENFIIWKNQKKLGKKKWGKQKSEGEKSAVK